MNTPPVASPYEWRAAHRQLRAKEKEVTALAASGRMPWLAVANDYAFEGSDGSASLLDLFQGRRQLLLYRAFYQPGMTGWPGARLRRVLVHGRPRPANGTSPRARHHRSRTPRPRRRRTSSA